MNGQYPWDVRGWNRELQIIAIVVVAVILGAPAFRVFAAPAGNGGMPASTLSVNRLHLRDGLMQVSKLKLDLNLAVLLADSIPRPIGSFLLLRDPELIGLDAACVPLDSTHGYPEHGFPGQRLYIFSGESALLYNIVVQRDSAAWRAVWSRIDPGCLPQPRLWLTRLGIEGDSGVTIGMMGLISATAYKSYSLMLWNGRTARDLFGGGADWLEEEDLDHDGIKELILHRGERHAEKNYPSREVYYFDAAKRVFRSNADTTGRTAPPK